MLNISTNRIEEGKIDKKRYRSFGQISQIRFGRKLAYWLTGFLCIILFVLMLPWRQTIISGGDLTTINPNQRPQSINSIIAGRIEKWYVKEGQLIKKGDTIVHISDIKETYYDPNLLKRTEEQLIAQRLKVKSLEVTVSSLDRQIDALEKTRDLKISQAKNRLTQANLKWEADSLLLEAANINLLIANRRFKRWEQLHKDGLISLTDFETRRMTLRQTQASQIGARNQLTSSKNDIINAQIELNSLENQYRDRLARTNSDKFASLSALYTAQATVAKTENLYKNYSFRFGIYYITAPQDGYVTRATTTGIGETIKEDDPLVTFMPADFQLAVQIYVNPVDLPLIRKGQKVRLLFDGWPAIVFSGWPNLSYGSFGGIVVGYNQFISPNGKYRVLVGPDPDDVPWPAALRIGSGAKGLALVGRVPVWYEIWRKLNGLSSKLLYRSYRRNEVEWMKIPFSIILLLGVMVQFSYAQTPEISEDSTFIFTLDQFNALVGAYHPVSKQAGVLTEQGRKFLLSTRGAFDPFVFTNLENKFFNLQTYWLIQRFGFQFPTWYGFEFLVKYEENFGDFLNPQNFTPRGGFLTMGASLSAVRGFFIDERRAALRQGQIIEQATLTERLSVLNNLFLESSTQYWNWVNSYQKLKVWEEFVELSEYRYFFVKGMYKQGANPAIDTLEAYIQYQDREVARNDAYLFFKNQGLNLSNFLWTEDNIPLEISDKLVPPDTLDIGLQENIDFDSLQAMIISLREFHPELRLFNYQLDILNVERRLKLEFLKPQVDISYYFLFQTSG
ncbi:HlyD family efflux transporter periplasmic adaptor subunit, partial [Xanthovirga aplysinae]|uniref:HlyD family efflux transporter periplasmic adaptor subunit n=1 Tax=Xanthovirga aplysinae TaxID=2529853 RepID=UPI0012BB59DB